MEGEPSRSSAPPPSISSGPRAHESAASAPAATGRGTGGEWDGGVVATVRRDGEPPPLRAAATSMRRLLLRTRAEEEGIEHSGLSPEMAANMVGPYLAGVADVYAGLPEEHQAAMRAELAAQMCDGSTSDTQYIVLARMAERAPDLTTPEGLDCVLRQQHNEGPALAATLDAWRRQGYPPTEAWENWRASATDPAIQRRFSSDETVASGRPIEHQ